MKNQWQALEIILLEREKLNQAEAGYLEKLSVVDTCKKGNSLIPRWPRAALIKSLSMAWPDEIFREFTDGPTFRETKCLREILNWEVLASWGN